MLKAGAAQQIPGARRPSGKRGRTRLAGDSGPPRACSLADEARLAGPGLRACGGRSAPVQRAAPARTAKISPREVGVVRRLQPRRAHAGHRLVGQHRAAVGGGDGQGDRRAARPRGSGVVRRLQPRRAHAGHRLVGQDRAAVGGGDGQGDRRAARPRGCGVVRRLQPRRAHAGHRLVRTTPRGCGRWRRARRSACCAATRVG